MIYMQPLPHIDNILWLSKIAGPFPTSTKHILDTARDWGFSQSSIRFLGLFARDEIFTSREEFLGRCAQVEARMRQERNSLSDRSLHHKIS